MKSKFAKIMERACMISDGFKFTVYWENLSISIKITVTEEMENDISVLP
jgi:hypothetical protein